MVREFAEKFALLIGDEHFGARLTLSRARSLVTSARLVTDLELARGLYLKQPRVNPGTLLHHPRLVSLLDAEDRAALLMLPVEALWALERKSDVDLEAIYGAGTFQLAARMDALILLKWRFDGEGFRARPLSTSDALASVHLFHKDLGAFDPDVAAATDPIELARYHALLSRLEVVEVLGRTDFPALRQLVADLSGARRDPMSSH